MAMRGYLPDGVTFEKALKNYMKAINKGLLKVFSKMGISTLQSYRGAQVFEAIGLNKALVDQYFTGTASRIEGVGLDVLAREAQMKHEHRLPARSPNRDTELPVGGNYQYRVRGEYHLLNPLTVSKLQHAVRQQSFETFQEYTDLIDEQSRAALHAARPDRIQDSRATRCRSKKWSRPAKSSSASPPAPCRSAPSARKRTRRWPSP